MRIALCVAALCCIAGTAKSQAADIGSRWASGMSVGLPGAMSAGATSPALFTVGANFTQIGRGAGADFSIFTAPRIMMEGAIPVVARLGIAKPIQLDSSFAQFFVPSAGVVGAGIMTQNGGGVIGGWYAGLAMMAFGKNGRGGRVAFNLHGLTAPVAWHLEIGLVGR
jgi:hypothetical protein